MDQADLDSFARYNIDPRYYRPLPDGGIVALSPSHCPAGHQLGPGRVQLGGDVTHRTWQCEECGAHWADRPVERHPEWKVWPGVKPDDG